MTMALVTAIIPLALFFGGFTGTILIVVSRPKGKSFPSCGNCGYDLTGSLGPDMSRPVTRCPECGVPFVTGGVVPPGRRGLPVVLYLGIIMLAATAVVFAMMFVSNRSTQQGGPILIMPTPNPPPPPAPPVGMR